MKKLILGLLAVCLITSVSAQDGMKSYRKATRALGAFNLDPANNKAKLKEAVSEIDEAIADAEAAAESKVWQAQGEIYNTIANQIVIVSSTNIDVSKEKATEGLPEVEDPAIKAANAFLKANELAEKRYEKKDAMEGLLIAQGNLSNIGIFEFQAQNYDAAFENFKLSLNAHKVLQENKEESTLAEEENYLNQLYITGLAALNAQKETDAASYFKELYEVKYDKPAIYEALYKIQVAEGDSEENMNKAYVYLEEGRKANPDDVSLLFAEINHFLRIGKLNELIDKLKTAIEKEPTNVSLYSTLGNVYDNLYQKALESGDEAKAQENFDEARKYYEQAMEKDPEYVDAVYSIGALYYNRAASMTEELNKLAEDYSKEGLKKYDALKKQIFGEFDKALPFFQKAEALAPNDMNTLIALKEIYARKDDLNMSNEFKSRIDRIQAGETIEKSYFDNK